MHDFWLSCGHHLLDRDEGGGLVVTDEFLKAYLARPELAPPPDACVVERTLHAALLADPRRPVDAAEIAAIADQDARENWTLMIAFRDRLCAHRTIEAAYLDLVRSGLRRARRRCSSTSSCTSILRNVLDGCEDAYVLRAAEMFFRPQRLTMHEGSLIAADEETVAGVNAQPASPLVSMLGLPAEAAIDVLNDDNADDYWERSDRFDMALDLTAGRRGLAALGEVIARWIKHLLADRGRRRAADRGERRQSHLVCRPRRAGHPDRRRALERRGARRAPLHARRRPLPADLPRSRPSSWTRRAASPSI